MAPRGTPKKTPQIQRRISRGKPSPAKTTTMSVKKTTETLRLKENNTVTTTRNTVTTVKETTESRLRTRTEPATPKPKENKPVAAPGSVTKSAKKAAWRRRPKPAHSGVPVPEKMRKLLEKYLHDEDAL